MKAIKCSECNGTHLEVTTQARFAQQPHGQWTAAVSLDEIEANEGVTLLSCVDCTNEQWSDSV